MSSTQHPWYRRRSYIHFDLPIGIREAEFIATSRRQVSSHSFYPFISYDKKSKKVRRGPDGGLEIKEKLRPIAYASHVDSHIYAYYSYILTEPYETFVKAAGIQNSVLAFRKLGKSNIDFANEAFNEIAERQHCTAIALDIEGFFDNMDHVILKNMWGLLLGTSRLPDDHFSVFKSLTTFAKTDKDAVYEKFGISKNNPRNGRKRICEPKEFRTFVRNGGLIRINGGQRGIPQGSPMSALLSNIFMMRFDETMARFMREIKGTYFRYCDDILCIVPPGRKDETMQKVLDEIGELKLNVNRDKTKVSAFRVVRGQLECDKPLQYLGFTYDGRHKLIRSAAFARFSERMKRGVRLAKLTKIKYNRLRIEKGTPREELYKRKIYERYSHLGRTNFIRYGLKGAQTMGSKAIRMQLKPLWRRLQEEISK